VTDLSLYSDRVVLDAPLRVTPACIRIAGSRIAEVVEVGRSSMPPGVLDLGDRLVTPAFVNGHTHLAMAAFRGIGSGTDFARNVVEDLFFRLESALEPEDVRAFTRLGAYECLLAGVGTVWDHYYGGVAVAEALLDTGLSGVVAPTVQDLSGPGARAWEAQLCATADVAASGRYLDAGVVAAAGPHATDTVSPELWRRVAEVAMGHDLPVHVHLAQSVEEYDRSLERHGCSPLEQLFRLGVLEQVPRLLLVHDLFVTERDLARLDPARHVLGCCPFSQLRFAFPADPLPWVRAGLRFQVGTDCAPSNDSMNVQKELRLLAGMHAMKTTFSDEHEAFRGGGPARPVAEHRRRAFEAAAPLRDPAQLLGAVWSVPGELHPALPCGRIRPGHFANLVVWDLDHPAFWPGSDPLGALAFADTTAAIDAMLVAGRFVGERGRFQTSVRESGEYREAEHEASGRLARLLGRLGLPAR
jgi:5-methylthioadenosine/S-adenosylhomocysteine deaminase